MPLIDVSGEQAISIRDVLFAAFPTEPQFIEVMTQANRNLDGVSGAGQPLPTRILEAVKTAAANNWLLDLLGAAVEKNPRDPALKALEDEFKIKAPPANISPYHMCRLGGGTVMVNRADLRDAVEEMREDEQGRRILLIRGDSRSGKSHSLQLITFIKQVKGGFEPIAIDLDPRRDDATRLVITAADLAERLIRLSGYPLAVPSPPTDRQWSKWVQSFGDDFARYAGADQARRWIVIDGMNKVLLDQSAVDLIQELAMRIYSSLPGMRLVLVGYEQTLPATILPYVQLDQPGRLTKEDLVTFFALVAQELRKTLDEDGVVEIVERVTAHIDMASSDYLMNLGPLVVNEVVTLRRRPS